MREYRFDGNFLYYVRLLKRRYEDCLIAAAKRCNLTLPEADVLCFRRENPEFDTARDVAMYRDVSRAYGSKAVEALVARGYLEIRRDEGDRRFQHLSISERAAEPAEILHEAQHAFYRDVTENLADAEVAELLRLIGKCAKRLEQGRPHRVPAHTGGRKQGF